MDPQSCDKLTVEDSIQYAKNQNMTEILLMLQKKAPASAVSEDNDGVGAIEYALESNASIDFIRTLQDMIAHYSETEDRKLAHQRCMDARRQLKKQASPHAAFAA